MLTSSFVRSQFACGQELREFFPLSCNCTYTVYLYIQHDWTERKFIEVLIVVSLVVCHVLSRELPLFFHEIVHFLWCSPHKWSLWGSRISCGVWFLVCSIWALKPANNGWETMARNDERKPMCLDLQNTPMKVDVMDFGFPLSVWTSKITFTFSEASRSFSLDTHGHLNS